MKKIVYRIACLTTLFLLIHVMKSAGCSRALYVGNDSLVITGRTMEWNEDMRTNLYMFPRGIARRGARAANALTWVSKYGSVIASGYDIGTADGMNEKGLVANILFLSESKYSRPNDTRRPLSLALWVQYMLDNFATVSEAVAEIRKNEFRISTAKLPNGTTALLHLSISDATGNSAIVEYCDGEPVIYEGKQYVVMTNSPFYDKQLAVYDYWKNVGGLNMLPGTNNSSDRFVRASFYIGIIPKTADPRIGVAAVSSVMRNVSVPFGISTKDKPNISTTIWRTVADQKNLRYYFEPVLSPCMFWIDLSRLDFSKGASIKKLPLTGGECYANDATSKMENSKGFRFLLVD